MKTKFKRHFRIYLVNNHPAYIVDEDGNQYIFHRVTESKTSGGKKNWKIAGANPIDNCSFTCYIVKKEQKDNKHRFSKQKLKIRKGVNIRYPWIKRANKKWPIGHIQAKVPQLNGPAISSLALLLKQH